MRLLRPTFTAGLALAATLALPGVGNAATISPALAADYGAGYLGRQLDANGGYIAALSGANYNTTALAVLALVAAEVGEEQAAAATEYLFDHVDAYVVDGDGADRPGALATLILVAHARGINASALVTRLLATERTTGEDAGLFGTQDATYDGTYRQALSLLALAAVGRTDADAVKWLVDEQCADGGWMGNNPDPTKPCPAFDFNTFVGEDTNGTALAAQALKALGVAPEHDPLDFLAEAQNEDGGFGFIPGFGSDANSTALVVQALVALGENLGDWAAPKGTPYSFLLSLQLGNPPAATAGAFAFQAGQNGALKADPFATAQVVPALAGKAFPIAPARLSTTLPLLPAPAAPKPPAKPNPPAKPTVPKPPAKPVATKAPATPAAPVVTRPRVVNAAPVPELPATGGIGEKPWDATGQLVFGLGLIGYGILALGGARLLARRQG